MAENMSIAEQFVDVLAMVRAMDADITNDHPERHQVRKMKRMAEAAIAEGLRRAAELVWLAKDLPSLVAEVDKQARKDMAGMQPVAETEQARDTPTWRDGVR